jgi:8-amino-7-oxononanoate synthase
MVPTVPKGQERIRICLHAKNSMVEVKGLVEAVEEWLLKAMKGQSECKDVMLMETTHCEPTSHGRDAGRAKI